MSDDIGQALCLLGIKKLRLVIYRLKDGGYISTETC